tara:strand:- start:7260 stop:8309 length:1050 start_codon:yes stop_codon:yes gene_type:complete
MAYTTINKHTDYFNTKLYTGNGGTQSITGVGFQPDWCWFKERSQANDHALFDAVRGVSKRLESNNSDAEVSMSPANAITSFDSDGFSLGSNGNVNENSQTYASWNWKAGGGQGSANNDGSINTTYTSANTTAGFSIVKWTGTGSAGTLGHGLGVAPKVVIVKNTINAYNWCVYHESNGNTKALYLNTNTTGATSSTFFNNTSPTNSVFSVGSDLAVNKSGSAIIAYCFAEKTGYSKIGKYSGNGNANGPFVYTGFKPSLIIIKDKDNSGENWFIFDNKRPGYNLNANHLNPNSDTTETNSSANTMDILSNGFKMRATNNGINRSGGDGFTYIAIGQSLVGSNNVPCTAR